MGAWALQAGAFAQAGEVRRYQALVGGLRSTYHGARADVLLSGVPEVVSSRTDHHTRNLVIDVSGGRRLTEADINAWLAPVHLRVHCLQQVPVDSPFTPLTRADCPLRPAAQDRDECFYDNEDWEGYPCDDPTMYFWAECGTPAYQATMEWSGGWCCYEWGQSCQDYYDQVAPVSCGASIPAHVDQNSQAFANTISTDPFCCSYQWDAWCDQLYNWSTPPLGCDSYTLSVTSGSVSGIQWNLVGGSTLVGSGGANTTTNLCILDGCYTMQMMSPDEANGWGGATWTLTDASSNVVAQGGLDSGLQGTALVPIGYSMAYCTTPPDPGGPVDPTTPPPASASDCPGAIPVCTNLSFQIEPNGWGELYEIPPLGSLTNPDLPFQPNPWGGSNYGCLRNRERNSTWMIVNIWEGGSLEFTFGGLGTQVGFYDWAMYPYDPATCGQVMGNTIPPVRCNWNGVAWGGTGLGMPPGGHYSNYEPPLNVQTGEQYLIYFSNWSHVHTSVPLIFGGTAVVDCRDVTLPVELVSFTATAEQDRVRLDWTTASEKNTSHFEVERSADLRTWQTIARLAAAGDSPNARHYSTVDSEPLPGTSYYRLRTNDSDGTHSYSAVAVVQQRPPLRCWPNPSNGNFQLEGVPAGARVEMVDALGRIYHTVVANEQGAMQFSLPGVPPGVYQLRISAEGYQHVQRISVLTSQPE